MNPSRWGAPSGRGLPVIIVIPRPEGVISARGIYPLVRFCTAVAVNAALHRR